jgi:3-phenylpropionate/trans-cinnamate dioxygenase ferredoxin reductase subunit
MADQKTHVIIGGGFAGAKAAGSLRDEGFDGRIVLIGAEAEQPYERPPLSKDYLRRESSRSDAHVHPDGFYDEHDIELRNETTVASVDPSAREVELEGGERIGYDGLLLATGAEPRRLPIDGADLDGVLYLRDADDSDRIAERLEAGGRAVIVGAGWIGSEVAASARQKGVEVTVIEQAKLPLERVLGSELGEVYAAIHRDHGVDLRLGTGLERFEGDGRVERAVLDGSAADCDFVVVGIGVAPRTELAEAAGIEVDNGIVTDERLATSADGVFAAGDVANALHPFYGERLRVEHWANALVQGEAAGKTMLGKDRGEVPLPYFFSDQYDVGMEYAGYATEWDEVVFRGNVEDREFIAFWVQAGRVVAGMNVNVWDVTDHIQALIRSRREVDLTQLRDPDVSLEDLASG